jgi:hypothetical protein
MEDATILIQGANYFFECTHIFELRIVGSPCGILLRFCSSQIIVVIELISSSKSYCYKIKIMTKCCMNCNNMCCILFIKFEPFCVIIIIFGLTYLHRINSWFMTFCVVPNFVISICPFHTANQKILSTSARDIIMMQIKSQEATSLNLQFGVGDQ